MHIPQTVQYDPTGLNSSQGAPRSCVIARLHATDGATDTPPTVGGGSCRHAPCEPFVGSAVIASVAGAAVVRATALPEGTSSCHVTPPCVIVARSSQAVVSSTQFAPGGCVLRSGVVCPLPRA